MHVHAIVAVLLLVTGSGSALAAENGGTAPSGFLRAAASHQLKDATARSLALSLGASRVASARLMQLLRAEKPGVALEEAVQALGTADATLADVVERRRAGKLGSAVPEVWMFVPEQGVGRQGWRDVLVAYPPEGDESQWTEVTAYNLRGERVQLDPFVEPSVPVIVVETYGRLAMHEGVAKANQLLQKAGLQQVAPAAEASATATSTWTVKLDQIRLRDDKEPWISGAAEIYAVTSGVIGDNQPQLQIVDLPYLDNDNTTYYPNQILLNWTSFDYAAANIQFFEHDSNTNYQSLVEALLTGIGAAGSLAGYPIVTAITEIANRIIEAMPSSWFTNDDDYVDCFYTIEKQRDYYNYTGVSGNATVTFTAYYLLANY